MKVFKKILVGIVVIILILAAGYVYFYQFEKKPIKIGGIFDLTGATSDVGVDGSLGVKDAVHWINDNGGINNRKIELIPNDYAYDIPKAKALYAKYTKELKIELIQGWGTADTEALMASANRDGVVYMSASYVAAITDPLHTPYNFFVGTDYSTSLRLAIKYIKEKHPDPSRPPKIVFIYPDHPYGHAPIPAGKKMAEELGVKYGPDQIVGLGAKEAIDQLSKVKEYNPDWVWLGGTVNSCAVVIRDAGKIGLDTKFIINTWGFDETLLAKAGPYANGRTYGVAPAALWGDSVPGMDDIMGAHKKYASAKTHTINYVKGWLSMMVMAEAIKRVKGSVSGYSVREALETVKDFNTGGLSAPISFSATDHRPNMQVKIYKIEGDKYQFVTEVKMERDTRFIGW